MLNVDSLTGHVRFTPTADFARLKAAIGPATASQDGLMPAADKAKLDDLDLATEWSDGLMSCSDKVTLDAISRYTTATISTNGYMSASDKRKLDDLRPATATTDGLMSKIHVQAIDRLEHQSHRGFMPVIFHPDTLMFDHLSLRFFRPDYLYMMCRPGTNPSTIDLCLFMQLVPEAWQNHSFLYFLIDNSQNSQPINVIITGEKCLYPDNTIVGPNEIREVSLRTSTWDTPIGSQLGTLRVMTISQPLHSNFTPNSNSLY